MNNKYNVSSRHSAFKTWKFRRHSRQTTSCLETKGREIFGKYKLVNMQREISFLMQKLCFVIVFGTIKLRKNKLCYLFLSVFLALNRNRLIKIQRSNFLISGLHKSRNYATFVSNCIHFGYLRSIIYPYRPREGRGFISQIN